MNYYNSVLGHRQKKLLELINTPTQHTDYVSDAYINHVEMARRYLKKNVDNILELDPCPRFVAVSGDRLFYGELDNEVSYRWITEGTTPGLILDLDPGFIDTRF